MTKHCKSFYNKHQANTLTSTKASKSRIFMGVDPGTYHTGFGLLYQTGNKLSYLASGTISPNKQLKLEERLDFIYNNLKHVFTQYQPHSVAIEGIFYSKNVKSSITLAHARAIPLLLAAHFKINCIELSPLEVKRACTGFGRASKQQVSDMMHRLLPALKQKDHVSEDESDALSIALCHLNSFSLLAQANNKTYKSKA